MNVFQSVVPKGTAKVTPTICLRPGDILAGNGKVIRKKTLDTRSAPICIPSVTEAERYARQVKRHYDDRWETGRSSLHRSF